MVLLLASLCLVIEFLILGTLSVLHHETLVALVDGLVLGINFCIIVFLFEARR